MTVIVWDHQILAVDSRRSQDGETTSDEAWKVKLTYPKARVRGKKVFAVVSCGNTDTTNAIRRMLKDGVDIETHFDELYTRGDLDSYKNGSVLIITRHNSYVFSIKTGKQPVMKVVSKEELVTLGSGGKYARFMIQVFGLSPQYAVAATILHKRCCGGPIRYYKRPASIMGATLGAGKVASIHYKSMDDLRQKVFAAVRKKCHHARDAE